MALLNPAGMAALDECLSLEATARDSLATRDDGRRETTVIGRKRRWAKLAKPRAESFSRDQGNELVRGAKWA